MNFIEGEVSNGHFLSREISLKLPETKYSELSKPRICLGIRPEHLHINRTPENSSLPAMVYVTELMGNETFVFLTVGQNRLIARAPADFRADQEEKVWLSFMMDKVHLFDADSELRIDS